MSWQGQAVSRHVVQQLAGQPGTGVTKRDGRDAMLSKAVDEMQRGAVLASRTGEGGNALTDAALLPIPLGPTTRNALTSAGDPSSLSPMPAEPTNVLQGAIMAPSGPMVAPAPMPPQAPPMPSRPMPPPSPNPDLYHVAQQAVAKDMSPADVDAAKVRANFVLHNLASLARQSGDITHADLARVGNQAVKSGAIPADQARAFVAALPSDPAGIRQSLHDRVRTAIVTAIHLAGATPAPGSPQQPKPDGNN